MSLVSGSIPNFINGVSQQPYALRLASQGTEQVNGYSTVAEGLVKRPPTSHVARLSAPINPALHLHTINRDANERYFAIFGNGSLRVYDIAGVERPVSFPNGTGYLAGQDFAATTVADYTMIVNRGVTTAMSGRVQPITPGHVGMVNIRQGNYSIAYTMVLNGTPYTFKTDKENPDTIATQYIAAKLREVALVADPSWSILVYGSTLVISRYDGADFQLVMADDVGDTYATVVKGRLQSFTNLPSRAAPNNQVEITGSPTNAFDNFYVQFIP